MTEKVFCENCGHYDGCGSCKNPILLEDTPFREADNNPSCYDTNQNNDCLHWMKKKSFLEKLFGIFGGEKSE